MARSGPHCAWSARLTDAAARRRRAAGARKQFATGARKRPAADAGRAVEAGAGRAVEAGAGSARRWLFLAAAIVLEVAGSLSLKGALSVPAFYLVVALGYAGAFVFLALTLRVRMPLGVAYGIWGAAGVVLTAVLSSLIFDEPLTPLMGAGIAIIIAGVLCVELGAQRARVTAGEDS